MGAIWDCYTRHRWLRLHLIGLSFVTKHFPSLDETSDSGGSTETLLEVNIRSSWIIRNVKTWNFTEGLPQFAELAVVHCRVQGICWSPRSSLPTVDALQLQQHKSWLRVCCPPRCHYFSFVATLTFAHNFELTRKSSQFTCPKKKPAIKAFECCILLFQSCSCGREESDPLV